MDIDSMEAGREMDALIAEKVMKVKVQKVWYEGPYPNREGVGEFTPMYPPRYANQLPTLDIPYYSTDIAAAWEVVEKMKRYGFALHIPRETDSDKGWRCLIATDETGMAKVVTGPTAPLAICRASLKTVVKAEKATNQES